MPASGSSRWVRLLFVLAACCLSHVSPAYAQSDCANRIGRIVSLQGEVQVQRARTIEWVSVKGLDVPLCIGDQIRTGLLSRAGLYISPETIVRLDQNTTLEFVEQTPEQTVVALRREEFNRVVEKRAGQCGVGYFITRFPRKLKVRTPFYNAVVEGTEFQVAMSCDRGELAVFEGKVAAEKLDAPSERVLVEGGQSASVGAGETPTGIKALVRPADAVQWALYYLPLSDVKLLTEDALAQDCAAVSPELRGGCAIRKAEYLLKVGRVAEARAQLESLSSAEPNNGDVMALQSIIALVQNDKAQALQLASRATQAAPNAFRSHAALSYAQQAHFKLDDALISAQRAAQLAPDSALMRARTAELQLSLGKTRAAERDAKEAVRLDPNESRAHLISGFVHLAQIDTKAAKGDFGKAIELDSTEPLARLGLGLATIREGKLQEGREQIEIAVALDPTNSLVRSYVGKAYYEENSKARDQLAATQFGLAKSLDPKDPTPWFYDAILKQTQNRPVEALQDLQQSIALNDNRAVYRSRLALDTDSATRMYNVAQTYEDLGLRRSALFAGAIAISTDPAAASPHRFLSDAYGYVEQTQISRISESMTARLLDPLGTSLLRLQQSETDLSFLTPLASDQGTMEFNHLYMTDGVTGQLGFLAGNRGTLGDELTASLLRGPVVLSAAQLYFHSDGFRPNNKVEHSIYALFAQWNIIPELMAQIELRYRDSHTGDIALNGDPDSFNASLRQQVRNDIARVGLRFAPTPRDTFLGSFIYAKRQQNFEQDSGLGGTVRSLNPDIGHQFEGQYIRRWDGVSLVGGLGFYNLGSKGEDIYDPGPCPFAPCTFRGEGERLNAYAYTYWRPKPWMQVTGGLSYDHFEDLNLHIDQYNPKLGVIAQVVPWLTIRAAAMRSLKPALVTSQTVEPTQVAGFTQFYDDKNGTAAEIYGVAADLRFDGRTFVGLEATQRRIRDPFGVFDVPFVLITKERAYKMSVDHFLSTSVSVGAAYSMDRWQRAPSDALNFGIVQSLKTKAITLNVGYLAEIGLYGRVWLHLVDQEVIDPTVPREPERFSLWDAEVGYRLPRRRGSIGIVAKNIFDRRFSFQDTNFNTAEPFTPRYLPARALVARVSLNF